MLSLFSGFFRCHPLVAVRKRNAKYGTSLRSEQVVDVVSLEGLKLSIRELRIVLIEQRVVKVMGLLNRFQNLNEVLLIVHVLNHALKTH